MMSDLRMDYGFSCAEKGAGRVPAPSLSIFNSGSLLLHRQSGRIADALVEDSLVHGRHDDLNGLHVLGRLDVGDGAAGPWLGIVRGIGHGDLYLKPVGGSALPAFFY